MENSNTLWISHRGGIYHGFTENTLKAFDQAVQDGFRILETDLRVTADDHIVLSHDEDLQRVAGMPIHVSKETKEQLEAITLPCGGRLAFFDEFVERYAAFRWVLDIKPETGFKVIEQLIIWAKNKNAHSWLTEQTYFLFWSAAQEKAFKTAFPGARVFSSQMESWRAGLSVCFSVPFLGGIKKGSWYGVPSKFGLKKLFQSSVVQTYHSRGAYVIGFLPNTAQEAKDAIEAGYDFILTDHEICK